MYDLRRELRSDKRSSFAVMSVMLGWCSVIIGFTLRLFTFSFTNLTFNLSLPLSLSSLCSYREGDTSMVSLCYASEQCYLSLSLPITKWVYVCITHMTWRDIAIFKLNLNLNSDYILPACLPTCRWGWLHAFFSFFIFCFFFLIRIVFSFTSILSMNNYE